MKRFIILPVALICYSVSLFGQSLAQTDSTKPETNENAEMIKMAGQLAKYGYAQEEILPLLQAAEFYQIFGGGALEANKTADVGGEDNSTQKVDKISYDVNDILEFATQLADGDPTYLAMINNVRNRATRGATKNYGVHTDRVNAFDTDTYTIRFVGGEEAIVVVSGDGDTDLDLYVYDSNGRLVDSDTDRTDDCVCVWTPRYTATYTIKIKNLGNVYNRYRMAVN